MIRCIASTMVTLEKMDAMFIPSIMERIEGKIPMSQML